jgi:hypothetical protein
MATAVQVSQGVIVPIATPGRSLTQARCPPLMNSTPDLCVVKI